MGGVASRESFFETGLEVLSDLGYGGLKLAEVCQRLGVTSGSFYHYFSSWSVYTHQLVEHWHELMTVKVVETVQAEPDPRTRLVRLIEAALLLPHGAESAIRVWSALDPEVRRVQAEVDRGRFDSLYDCAIVILQNRRQAQLFAAWGVYMLVGYEQTLLPPDTDGLTWIIAQLLEAMDSGRFATVPDDE